MLSEMGVPKDWRSIYKVAVAKAMTQFDPSDPSRLPEIRAKAKALWNSPNALV